MYIKRKTVCYRIKGFAFTFLFFSLFDKWIRLLLLFLLFSIKFYALLYTGLPSCLYTKNSPINGKCFCTYRTPCKYRGKNIAFHVNEGSTDYWLSLLVEYEGGDGDVGSMHIKEVCSFLLLLSFYLVYCFLPLFWSTIYSIFVLWSPNKKRLKINNKKEVKEHVSSRSTKLHMINKLLKSMKLILNKCVSNFNFKVIVFT